MTRVLEMQLYNKDAGIISKILTRFGTKYFFRNDDHCHSPFFFLVHERVVKRTIDRLKALRQTNSVIASDLKVNKFPACYGQYTARARFFLSVPRNSQKPIGFATTRQDVLRYHMRRYPGVCLAQSFAMIVVLLCNSRRP